MPAEQHASDPQQRIAAAVREIIDALGIDATTDGIARTPLRVARMYAELFSGVGADAGEPLRTSFTLADSSIVVFRDIPFYSICEHHFMPFFGTAQIAYQPDGRITGLSKVVRSLRILCARPQVQERLTGELAALLMTELAAKGAAVALTARHLCMEMRGVRSPGGAVSTCVMRGCFETDTHCFSMLASAGFSAGAASGIAHGE